MQLKKHQTILYVEDEPLIREQAVEYLSFHYDNVLEAGDGEEAFVQYDQHQPDIIITDIEMPKLNGLGLARRIRQSDRTTPIIVATAYTDTEYLLEAVELQLVKYMVKPITHAKLQEALGLAHGYLEDQQSSVLSLATMTQYDLLNKTLVIDGQVIKLTHNEMLLCDLLCQNHQRVVTYEEIESVIWAYEGMSMDSLRSLMRTLRKKLQGNYVENVSGVGYRIKAKV